MNYVFNEFIFYHFYLQLMENMAQLWLQQEVKDLEGHETKGKYSPYIVVDHMAMINHMFAIKDIVASKKFAVIVPNAGEDSYNLSLNVTRYVHYR